MVSEELKACAGYSVNILINERRAVGILRFAEDGSPCITSLCFVDPEGECPMLSRPLDAVEIESLKDMGNCHLDSSITITVDEAKPRMTAMDRLISGGDPSATD